MRGPETPITTLSSTGMGLPEQFLPPDDIRPTRAPPRQNEDGSRPRFLFGLAEKEGIQHGLLQHICLKVKMGFVLQTRQGIVKEECLTRRQLTPETATRTRSYIRCGSDGRTAWLSPPTLQNVSLCSEPPRSNMMHPEYLLNRELNLRN